MTKLLWTLARRDCLAAQLLLLRGDHCAAVVFFHRAIELLECRARLRDPEEPWQSVLGASEIDRMS